MAIDADRGNTLILIQRIQQSKLLLVQCDLFIWFGWTTLHLRLVCKCEHCHVK